MKQDIKITLLTEEEVKIDEDKSIEIFRTDMYGIKPILTDLTILTGADKDYKDRNWSSMTFLYYLEKGNMSGNIVQCINHTGKIRTTKEEDRNSVRPVLIPKKFDDIIFNKYSIGAIDEVEFGEYPQYAAYIKMQAKLEEEFIYKDLKETGKVYTFDSEEVNSTRPFLPIKYPEYEFEGKKYIRVIAKSGFVDSYKFLLSNNQTYTNGDYVWVEVSPVRWLIDYKSKKLISKNVLVSGIMYNHSSNTKPVPDIIQYLENYMLPELLQHHQTNILQKQNKNIKKEVNSFNLKFDTVTEEDIIKGAIESNVPVFLHGPSSEGKSARVKQIDSDCEIIYLRNATPESLNGKSVYNQSTGEMKDIPPTWLKKVKDKCLKEPDKLHIIFFDELTNALPSIQGMAFNIILDREVNGIWKLPKNARIVASGNEMSDSLAANQLAEPLFNRFAHVYIKTTVSDWLKWASENNIHPAIYTYIAYKKEAALRSKYDGRSPNADPRKWEMASKMLYQTGNPYMLRSLVGEDITQEFVAFCKNKVITLDDVINENYTEVDISLLNTASKYVTAMSLTSVSEEHLEVVRNFIQKLGSEYRAIFDTLWTHNDESRLERIAELGQPSDIDDENIEFQQQSNSESNSGINEKQYLDNLDTAVKVMKKLLDTGGFGYMG